MYPWRPSSGTVQHVNIELPSVAVDVPAGQSLFVIAAATNDMYAGFGSLRRVPCAAERKVALPIVR